MTRHRGEGRSNIIEMTVALVHQTDKAALVRREHDPDGAPVWLALALIELEPQAGGLFRVHLPEWLAIEKRLL